MILNLFVQCWKSATANYPAGQDIQITCQHINEGYYVVNSAGEVFPASGSVVPWQEGGPAPIMVNAGTIIPPAFNPFPTNDPNYHLCYKIKDPNTGIVYYADVADYNSKIGPTCNPTPGLGACNAPTNLSILTNTGGGTIKVGWTDGLGALIGSEVFTQTPVTGNPTPPPDGSFAPLGAGSGSGFTINGLTPATSYAVYIRTICGLGAFSAFSKVTFTTHA